MFNKCDVIICMIVILTIQVNQLTRDLKCKFAVVPKITYLIKMNTDDRQTDRQTETGENIKVAIRPMDSITILSSLTLG